MQLKHITIALQLKVPGFWLKVRARILGRRQRESKTERPPDEDQRP